MMSWDFFVCISKQIEGGNVSVSYYPSYIPNFVTYIKIIFLIEGLSGYLGFGNFFPGCPRKLFSEHNKITATQKSLFPRALHIFLKC